MAILQTIHRGVRQMKISAWNAENSYGTAYLIRGVRSASLELVVESDELRGDDVVLDRYTKIVSANVNVEQATVDLTAYDMMTGSTLVSNADYEDVMISESEEVPYIAVAVRVVGSGGVGDLHMFFPKTKLSGNLALNAQLDTFILPGAQFQAVSEGTINGIYRLRNFRTPTLLTIPLRTAVGGL